MNLLLLLGICCTFLNVEMQNVNAFDNSKGTSVTDPDPRIHLILCRFPKLDRTFFLGPGAGTVG